MSDIKERVLEKFANDHEASNQQVIAEYIRLLLKEARACDDEVSEAEQRVAAMLHTDFVNPSIVKPFKITEGLNFTRWSLTVRYPTGTMYDIDQDS